MPIPILYKIIALYHTIELYILTCISAMFEFGTIQVQNNARMAHEGEWMTRRSGNLLDQIVNSPKLP